MVKTKNIIIMPKGTALWLKNHTKLTQQQISDFCQVDLLTLSSLNSNNTSEFNPLSIGQLTESEITKCESNPLLSLKNCMNLNLILSKSTRKFVPKSHKIKRVPAIIWIFNQKIDASIEKIAKLFSSRKTYVEKLLASFKENPGIFSEIINPVKAGLCTQDDLDKILLS